MANDQQRARRVRKPRFQRGTTWVATKFIRVTSTCSHEPGEELPSTYRRHYLQYLWRRNCIGPKGNDWTEQQLARHKRDQDRKRSRPKTPLERRAEEEAAEAARAAQEAAAGGDPEGEGEDPAGGDTGGQDAPQGEGDPEGGDPAPEDTGGEEGPSEGQGEPQDDGADDDAPEVEAVGGGWYQITRGDEVLAKLRGAEAVNGWLEANGYEAAL